MSTNLEPIQILTKKLLMAQERKKIAFRHKDCMDCYSVTEHIIIKTLLIQIMQETQKN
jgi:hypothetical protein